MAWRIQTSKSVDKFLEKHRDIAPKILQIMRTLAEDPYNNDLDIKKLSNVLNGYRVRTSKFRIAYKLNKTEKIISFSEADARGGIYKKVNRKQ